MNSTKGAQELQKENLRVGPQTVNCCSTRLSLRNSDHRNSIPVPAEMRHQVK